MKLFANFKVIFEGSVKLLKLFSKFEPSANWTNQITNNSHDIKHMHVAVC